MEIERKFLVRGDAVPEGLVGTEILQGYLAIEDTGREVRVRKKGERSCLTVKSGGGVSREEIEVPITEAQFQALLPAAKGRVIQKTRFEVPLDGLTGELDIYHGRHQGLSTIEVEFDSEENAHSFTPPSWFGEEKTSDPCFKNANLAQSGAILSES